MLVVTVDIVPGGYEPHRRTIGSLQIANISNLSEVSDYDVAVMEGPNPLTGAKARAASVAVKNHHRRQTVWALIAKAAHAAEGARFEEVSRSQKG
jgi:hypothetical protein